MKVYLSTYAIYNSGKLTGKWVELPKDIDRQDGETFDEKVDNLMADVFEEDAKCGGDREIMIQDTDGDGSFIFRSEHQSLCEMYDDIVRYDRLSDYEQEALKVMVNGGMSVDDAFSTAESGDFEYYELDYSEYSSFEEMYGYHIADELDNIPEHLYNYINFEAYGRDALMDFSVYEDDGRYVVVHY